MHWLLIEQLSRIVETKYRIVDMYIFNIDNIITDYHVSGIWFNCQAVIENVNVEYVCLGDSSAWILPMKYPV